MGTNVGADADSVATMGGAIYGAMIGPSAFATEDITLIERQNTFDPAGTAHFDLKAMAKALDAVIAQRRS